MDLLEKINEVLREKNVSFEAFAEHIGVSEELLNEAFANNTLEIRTLEKISKELRIPLYRFFREPIGSLLEGSKDHPIFATITHDELAYIKLQLEIAQKEIKILKDELESQNEYIKQLKSQKKPTV